MTGRPKGTARPLAERFWAKVGKLEDGCWLWEGSVNRGGYGQVALWQAKRTAMAHRIAWELTNGPIPDGLHVLHRCDVRNCVRPDHLFLGTLKDNAVDMAAKGRSWFQRNPDKCRGEAHHRAVLTAEGVATIRRMRAEGQTLAAIAAAVSASKTTVGDVLRGRTWSS